MLEAYRRWGICRCQLGHMLAASGAIQCRQSPAPSGGNAAARPDWAASDRLGWPFSTHIRQGRLQVRCEGAYQAVWGLREPRQAMDARKPPATLLAGRTGAHRSY
ncbi:hypothetical protein EIJ57_20490 [Xanthomonas perforans]|nr:hypothetical protein DB761_09235 [Xanthomonas perforans]RXD47460.1 hypothetical protein DB768_14315 [Xanthomonas perforans]RXD62485.1 hypothetical protein DB759_10715 [Xanthomonas perforans]RXD74201.1 hypothetical protein DB756_09095 [Xanthomonas perforans]RXD75723.1 hypothetical protein DB763_05615 [Xanthomonas perforans]